MSIVDDYFRSFPKQKRHVERAHFAYHATGKLPFDHRWPRFPEINWHLSKGDPFQHLRHDQCMACGRTRFEVRHGIEPPECSKWKPIDIEKTLIGEEQAFFALIESSKPTIDKIIRKKGLSGATLAYLHHTHGIDIEVVETHIELTDELRKDYMVEWERHCATGGEFK